ncbi:hypothetical protein KOW79_003123 [Hemibagrus wyckioides]|uniref:Ig-like domain-containing protein n=1 Tax=Hemibagrus wyckioides TaxID=337641 RepID=A0A9D3SVQ4_9TELE|nr:uncharacterized protein LOC131352120 [Hemibagrus wyckioides]KAG7332988.1 hypothetical protein KOW79_003123 [Hemibagrus wyckioides]
MTVCSVQIDISLTCEQGTVVSRSGHKNNSMELKMKPVLMAVFLHILSTSLQEESLARLSPARIYNGGVTKVNESENVTFKCKADNIKENTSIIYMYLFKHGETVVLQAINATTEYDTVFTLTNITVEHSGCYTCLYSEEDLRVSRTNATGHNSVSLEVLSKILPGKIEITEKGETLKLTCTFTKIPNCAQVYVYLTFNGIGNSKKQVICSHTTISTTFQLIFSKENSGNYSCVYSVSNYSLSEVRNTGENTIFVKEHEATTIPLSLIIGVLVAVSVVLLALFGFYRYQDILSIKVCQDPEVRNIPNHEPFYHEIATEDHLYTLADGELKSFGGSPVELVDSATAPYSTVQMHEADEQPSNRTTEAAYYDSIKAPYAAIQKRKASETYAIYSLEKC